MARFFTPKDVNSHSVGFETLDGDEMNLSFRGPVPSTLQHMSPRSRFGGGARVSSRNMPTKLIFKGRKRELIDIDNALHMFLVSARFVDLVRGFQSTIQVFPVDCSWSDGTHAGDFFLFFVPVMLDAVVREKTTATWRPTPPNGGFWIGRGEQIFVFDKSRMGDVHIWLDPNMPTYGPVISEALHSALRGADMQSFYDCDKYEEI